jgi:hypothetical protein
VRRLRDGRSVAAAAVVLGVWCAGFLMPDLHLAVLYLAPALLLATALLAGRYPGEVLLERIAARRAARPRAERAEARDHPRSLARVAVRGGLLLARSLAGRAPPCLREV